ncbi:MerR family transcriptional regulator [Caenispirillum bisanense]|uniref:MerR HTH family regulatory protein n=1 Tax=Caenispirillum bisanense TaxID=414052 RepID=A0A286GG19_9PROT|nr:MerR family transcriptional regulator [Caenispirillum bisanense]SOD94176.1 MerR HTH family regulatory protein [Caenispirillum bisanense]
MTDSTAGPRAAAGKSEAAFRTISEVAEELDVPQHVLRFWETKFTQIRPMKRGGGRRYYRPEDVALLQRIRALLYDDGLTIKGVQKLLREKGVKALVGDPQPLPATLAEVEAPAVADDRAPTLPFDAAPAAPDAAVAGLSARQRQEIETALAELIALRDDLAAELRRQEAA